MEALKDEFVADELLRCNRCGYCTATCPTYRAVRDERQVARARNHLLRQLSEGRMDLLAELHEPLFGCLLCGACTETCFASVKTDELMVRAREAWHDEHGKPDALRIIFDELLPHPQRLTRLMRLFSVAKRSHLSGLARRLGVLRWINATLDGAEGLVETMPRRFLRDRLSAMGFRPERTDAAVRWTRPSSDDAPPAAPAIVFFIGCGTNYQLPRQGEAAMKLLASAGCKLTVLENVCCGLPPYSYGDREAARRLARQNLGLFAEERFDLLVTECASCSAFLKKWPALLAEDEMEQPAQTLSGKVRDFTELLAEMHLPKSTGASQLSVTYHDPCHLRRGQGIVDEPRRLLTDVAGVDLRELPEAEWCCGGAGSYNIAHPQLSLEILERKMSRVEETGADVVATSCPACVIQLDYGGRMRKSQRSVRHVAELIAESRGIALET